MAELRALLGQPKARSLAKDIGRLDAHCRAFIALSPFLMMSTSAVDGRCDASPRGDQPGFVAVLDDHTLALPERPGNRRADSLTNLLDNPEVGLLFLVPGVEEELRVNGPARLVRDGWLLDRLAVEQKRPQLAIVVTVREAYFHCAKAVRRAQLWDPARQPPRSAIPSLGCILHDQLGVTDQSAAEMDAALEESYRATLW
jgi:PPOX class probable FMN-dependent enzyme